MPSGRAGCECSPSRPHVILGIANSVLIGDALPLEFFALTKGAHMSPLITSIVRWAARGSAILIAAAFLAFALGEPSGSLQAIQFRDRAGMVLLIGAIAAMLLAWIWERPAALISIFALGGFAGVVHMRRYDVLVVLAIPNILFLLDWKLRRLHSGSISKVG